MAHCSYCAAMPKYVGVYVSCMVAMHVPCVSIVCGLFLVANALYVSARELCVACISASDVPARA
jgi:hypothetical protein